MEKHYMLTDIEFEQQFADAVLDPNIFTHEAHLRLAWIHLTRYGLGNAIENVTSQLRIYTRVVGAADKYNETVTIAAVYAVEHFRLRCSCSDFGSFITINSQLKSSFRSLIETHYRTDIFKSERARSSFLEPDLAPFD